MGSPRTAAFGEGRRRAKKKQSNKLAESQKRGEFKTCVWSGRRGLAAEAAESQDVYSGGGGGGNGGSVQGRRGAGILGAIKASDSAPSVGASLGGPSRGRQRERGEPGTANNGCRHI